MLFSLKQNLIVLTIIFLMLVGFINSSDAITFEVFPSDTEHDALEGYIYYSAYVKTDKPIFHISWYIDDEWVFGQTLGSTTSEAWFSPGDRISGSIRGNEYKIGARVWEWDERHGFFRSHSDSYTLTVFQGLVDAGVKEKQNGSVTGVWGFAKCYRHYYDGSSINVDCGIYAYNGTEKDWHAHGRFQHYINNVLQDEEDQPYLAVPAGGGTYELRSRSFSYRIPTDTGRIGKGRTYKSNAYIKLYVEGQDGLKFIQDSWDAGNTETFTDQDNPEN